MGGRSGKQEWRAGFVRLCKARENLCSLFRQRWFFCLFVFRRVMTYILSYINLCSKLCYIMFLATMQEREDSNARFCKSKENNWEIAGWVRVAAVGMTEFFRQGCQ